jgi:hypothetical protein
MRQLILSRLLTLRAMVVVVALFSFCVSSNVGPCFLPLPALENYEAENVQQILRVKASRLPFGEPSSFRVPIAHGQKRVDLDGQAQSLALMPGVNFVLSNNTRVFAERSHCEPLFTLDLASLPLGRAPPRLV